MKVKLNILVSFALHIFFLIFCGEEELFLGKEKGSKSVGSLNWEEATEILTT